MSHFLFHNNTASLNDLWYESHASVIKMVAMELGGSDKIPELLEKYLGQKMKIKGHQKIQINRKEQRLDLCFIVRKSVLDLSKSKGKREKRL